ncbi:hypothetical protein ACTFIZ_008608 [Dictyostelium cf. discoideum]
MTKITVVIPTIAPKSIKPATQFCPAYCKANETGTVQTANEPIMPIGKSLLGFLTSSAAEVTASKPINSKNHSNENYTLKATLNTTQIKIGFKLALKVIFKNVI